MITLQPALPSRASWRDKIKSRQLPRFLPEQTPGMKLLWAGAPGWGAGDEVHVRPAPQEGGGGRSGGSSLLLEVKPHHTVSLASHLDAQ